MKQYLNDVTTMPKKCDELDGVLVCASGYDPMKYIDPRNGTAGNLGFDTWIGPRDKPYFISEGTGGTLNTAKYYSILVVPVDRTTVTGADFQRGTPTQYSVPVSPSGATPTLNFDIPIHGQLTTVEVGDYTAGGAGTFTDGTKSWTVDELVGYTAENIDTGERGEITANTATVVTVSGVDFSTGSRYAIKQVKATARDIYAFEMTNESDVVGGVFVYQGTVNDNTTTTWELSVYIQAGAAPPYSNVPPEPFAYCRSADNRVFAGGGVESQIGQASANLTEQVIQAALPTGPDDFGTATSAGYGIQDTLKTWTPNAFVGRRVYNYATGLSANILSNSASVLTVDSDLETSVGDAYAIWTPATDFAVHVSIYTELYNGSNAGKVVIYSLGVALPLPTTIYEGSFVTIENALNAGNNIEDAIVIAVAEDKSWFAIENPSAVDDNADNTMTVTIKPNVITGTGTNFSQGMVGADFSFDGENQYTVYWVDEINQILTLAQLYTGNATTDTDITITTDYNLFWSDYGNPHVWRTENSTEIADRILSIEIWGGLILVFCSRSIWKIPLNNLFQNPTLVDDNITFVAPFSVVTTPRGVMFHDGSGFSVTDGQSVRSITQYKATDLMRTLNSDMSYNIRGEYDSGNRRVEYTFATGTDVTNNTGLYITIDSLNIYPFSRLDSNVIWEDEDADGRPIMMHGTSGRHVTSGNGTIYSHPIDQATDGTIAGSTFGVIDEVNADHLIVTFDGAVTAGEGTYCLHYPAPGVGGTIVQFIAENITLQSGTTYRIDFTDDWYSAGFSVGGYLYLMMIPMDYGIKWLDFGSPQYQHKVRQLQLDVRNFLGSLIIEHYGDLNDGTPIQVDTVNLTNSDTKIIVPIKKGSYYTYGFRLRGYSSTRAKILSMEVLFDTEI
jgi:hypothetical protein